MVRAIRRVVEASNRVIKYEFRFSVVGNNVKEITTKAENIILQAGLKPTDFEIDIELEPVYNTGDAVADILHWKADIWAFPFDDDGDGDIVTPIRPARLKVGT